MTKDYKILLDIPFEITKKTARSALRADDLATAFQQVIESSDPQFAVGLFGGRGSGKTTLMRAIEAKLDPKTCATVWFPAWRYEKEGHLIVPMSDVMREGIVAWADDNATAYAQAAKTARGVAETIGNIVQTLLTGLSIKAGPIGLDAGKVIAAAGKLDTDQAKEAAPKSL